MDNKEPHLLALATSSGTVICENGQIVRDPVP